MAVYVADPDVEERLLAERRRTGADRFDEVWDGVYVVAPVADNEHQGLASELGFVVRVVLGWNIGAIIYAGVNVSDRPGNWQENYRCPDVAVFLAGTRAQDRGTHWYGGPDFAVEIISPGDRSREKLTFYARVGVRELLLIDRDPWQLELFRLHGKKFRRVGSSSLTKPAVLASKVLPLTFRLVAGKQRPHIEINHTDGVQHWQV